MSMKPILFNTTMVRAILDGRKTVTRRVVKIKWFDITGVPGWTTEGGSPFWFNVCKTVKDNGHKAATSVLAKPPYHSGDIMYVRETFRLIDFDFIDGDWSASVNYKVDDGIGPRFHYLPYGSDEKIGWRPSIHMPREAARIFLRVTDVRVERLQDITDEDIVRDFDFCSEAIRAVGRDALAKPFWDSTIKPADRALYGWDASPWVWVIEFERISREKAYHESG